MARKLLLSPTCTTALLLLPMILFIHLWGTSPSSPHASDSQRLATPIVAAAAPKANDMPPPQRPTQSTQSTLPGRWSLTLLPNVSRCMDGSAGGVYIRTPSKPTTRWLLLFTDGVGWCHHFSTCRARGFGAPFYTSASSSKWTNTPKFPLAGITGPDSPFGGWMAAAFGYCDGSAFLGNRKRVTLVGGKPYLFHGHFNLQAYLEFLRDIHKLQDAREVVIFGAGYGALATLLQLRHLREWFPRTISLAAIVEAPMFLHAPELPMGREESRRMTMAAAAWNATPVLAPECLAEHANQSFLCLFPEYFGRWLPRNVPIFIAQKTFEPMALKLYAGVTDEGAVSKEVQLAIQTHVQASHKAVSPSGWLSSCGPDPVLTSTKCTTLTVGENGLTPCAAVQTWYSTYGQRPFTFEQKCAPGGAPT